MKKYHSIISIVNLLAAATSFADSESSPKHAQYLKPGALILTDCPTCTHGFAVDRVISAKAAGTYTEIKFDAILSLGIAKRKDLMSVLCGSKTRPPYENTRMVTSYDYYSLDRGGKFFRLSSPPTVAFSLAADEIEKVKRCERIHDVDYSKDVSTPEGIADEFLRSGKDFTLPKAKYTALNKADRELVIKGFIWQLNDIDTIERSGTSRMASDALVALGLDSSSPLISFIKSQLENYVGYVQALGPALLVLGKLRSPSQDTRGTLLKALERQETFVAAPAATALASLGSKDPEVIKPLKNAARRTYPMNDGTSRPAIELMQASILAINDLGESAEDLLPLLASQAKFHKKEVLSLLKTMKGHASTSAGTKQVIDDYLKNIQ